MFLNPPNQEVGNYGFPGVIIATRFNKGSGFLLTNSTGYTPGKHGDLLLNQVKLCKYVGVKHAGTSLRSKKIPFP